MLATTLAHRIRYLRERDNLSQDELAQKLGINDRQTVSAIENGKRAVTATELVAVSDLFNVDIDVLTDRFSLIGEGAFSWRQSNNDPEDLEAFEIKAGRWIALYRELRRADDTQPNLVMPEVRVSPYMSYEDAVALGEEMAKKLELGEVPAAQLHFKLVDKLQTLVLFIDAIPGVSGAACRLADLNAILINRKEQRGRRNFDLGHELFHLLTWLTFPPQHLESDRPQGKYKRIEQLADNFCSGLLMPYSVLKPYLESRGDIELHSWLNRTATNLHVSSISLFYRLKNLDLLTQTEVSSIEPDRLKHNGNGDGPDSDEPLPFNREFVVCVHKAIEEGTLSVRRVASILDINIDDISALFKAYGLSSPFDL